MTEEEKEFTEEAVSTLASAMKSATEDEEKSLGESKLLNAIAEVSNYYGIPPKERVDFAVEGLDRMIEKQKIQIISDFRQQMESLERIWDREDDEEI